MRPAPIASPQVPGQAPGQGWLPDARRIVSPNQDERPDGIAVDALILHHISLPPGRFAGDAIERLFTNRLDAAAHPYYATIAGARVSAHFLLRRHGALVQFVATDRRAWHAGVSSLMGRARCNDFSIGIELEGDSRRDFTPSQYRRLRALIETLAAMHRIRHVAGHSDVAPGRKVDPGPRFDWSRIDDLLRRLGIARFSVEAPPAT
ncbi:MAG: 1,6-anhydro-N-acetylmuramyl-L-alanine amidase AmpD [Lautropia sp.]